jgi:hypothetical protein
MKAEKEFVDELALKFSKYFEVQKEVVSKCKNNRIDLLLTIDGKYHFGIECKKPDKKRGEEIGRYVLQAIRYTTAEWEYRPSEFVKALIFICPPLSFNYFCLSNETKIIDGITHHIDRHDKLHDHHSFNGFLGVFNIGEVRKKPLGYQFALNNKPIFEHKIYPHNGRDLTHVHEVNYNFYMNKLCNQ